MEEIRLPYVMKHAITSKLYTCMLVNGYRLPYYGTKYWDDEEAAKLDYHDFLNIQGVADPDSWQLLELTENQLKMCNVKLKNDSRFILHWDQVVQAAVASISPSEL
ncbi:hypothetical protein [Paenibacillus sp. FSL H8-0034]|uniref:hypothetical protein n=1 Tax=Paenibacillus sp. FSL H8-0034 TaxID=2954671 RepID=UPI0030F5A4BD